MEITESYSVELEALKRENLVRVKFYFFMAAALSFLLSVYLFFSGDKVSGVFVGLWVPSILTAGTLIVGGHHYE
ncbi:MAG: hypothetical protein KDD40_08440 [Bdellovibrionales bacterium]|nr:hypothetical protein [Bdellovibrionales bacterium]